MGGFSLVHQIRIAEASTQVSGIILSDSTWTKANSPYDLMGNVLVNNGVKLTIEPGVTVNLGSYYIMVNGTLGASGNSVNQISFNGGQITFTKYSVAWNESNGSGCLIENAILNSTLEVNSGVRISNSLVHSHINVAYTPVATLILNSILRGGINIYREGMATISRNTILNNGVTLNPENTASNTTILGNTISGCATGISSGFSMNSNHVLIEGNVIVNNTKGIGITDWFPQSPGTATMRNNTIANNTIGIWLENGTGYTIARNNIYGNSNYNIELHTPSDIVATYNWWGTTNETLIDEYIYDYYDGDFLLGRVFYKPYVQPPNVNFTYSPTTAYANATVSFDASGSYSSYTSIANYLWDFGDGNTTLSTSSNITHTYATTGNFIVKLTATDNFGLNNSTKNSLTLLQDNVAPATTHDYVISWHVSDFRINLTASDSSSGVAATYYRINSGSIQTVGVNGQPYITTDGALNTLEYWSFDFAGNEEFPHKLLTGIKLDKTAPAGSILINNGNASTSSTSVTLNLTYVDAVSGVSQVRYSNDGLWDTEAWEAPVASRSWTLTTGDGTKTVYFQVKDYVGLLSPTYPDTIALNTTITHYLRVAPPIGNGEVLVNGTLHTGDDVAFTSGDVANITAVPDSGWIFGSWANLSAPALVGNPVYHTMTENKSAWAIFTEIPVYNLKVVPPVGNGEVYLNGTLYTGGGDVAFISGDMANLTASPALGWVFDSWAFGIGTSNPLYLTVTGNVSAWATFTEIDVIAPTGSISINNGTAYTSSTSVTLYLNYSDAGSGVSQIRCSNDGDWDNESWELPALAKLWFLSSGDGNKTVYYQIIDNAGLLSSVYSDSIILVTSGPGGSIIVNSGDAATSSTSVMLSLTYADASGVSGVRYSNDGTWDTEAWEAPTASKLWLLTSGDGSKTVHYQVRNNAGLTSAFLATIILDTSPPTGSIIINGGSTYSNSTKVTLDLAASDETSGISQVRFSNDGEWDTENWETQSSTKTWMLTPGDEIKNVYCEIKDNAGLTSTFSSWIFLDMTLPVANAGQGQSVIAGQSVTFNGGGSTDNLNIATYLWDFGDGSAGSGVEPTHTYSSVGNYTVRLTVVDFAGNAATDNSVVTVEAVIPEFPSSLLTVLIVVSLSASTLFFRKKLKIQN